MQTQDQRYRLTPARLRRDAAERGQLGPVSSIWQYMRRRPKWLLIVVVLGALFFGRPDAPGYLNGVGLRQTGLMAPQTLKAAGEPSLAGPGATEHARRPRAGDRRDTIVLTDTNTHIRLNGVAAPEVVHPGYDHDDPFGPEARDEMRRIVTISS
jgi:hypothetical protein